MHIPGEELTLEDTYHMESLMKKLKMIEKRQAALQEVVDADVKKVNRRCIAKPSSLHMAIMEQCS